MGVRRLSTGLLFLGLVGAMLGGGGACGSGGGAIRCAIRIFGIRTSRPVWPTSGRKLRMASR